MPHHRVSRATLLRGFGAAAILGVAGFSRTARATEQPFEIHYTDAQWHKRLSPERYAILREAQTETPWSSKLEYEHRRGIYACAACGLSLFSSETKFESGTGWPSFYRALPNAVTERTDRSLLEVRTEILCRRCGSHLGHVFNDGPQPTGLRYCMNGLALVFHPARQSSAHSG